MKFTQLAQFLNCVKLHNLYNLLLQIKQFTQFGQFARFNELLTAQLAQFTQLNQLAQIAIKFVLFLLAMLIHKFTFNLTYLFNRKCMQSGIETRLSVRRADALTGVPIVFTVVF